jgi:hypothetical protein
LAPVNNHISKERQRNYVHFDLFTNGRLHAY